MTDQTRGPIEEIQVGARELLSTIRNIVHEGNVRRIIIRNPDGRTLLDIPLTAGVIGAALLPLWAAIAALAAVAARYTIIVERSEDPPASPPSTTAP